MSLFEDNKNRNKQYQAELLYKYLYNSQMWYEDILYIKWIIVYRKIKLGIWDIYKWKSDIYSIYTVFYVLGNN